MTAHSAPSSHELRSWHPTPAEVQRIVIEMRPIIQDFARRAERECAAQQAATAN